MKYIWFLASIAAIYGALAGMFFDKTPMTAIAFAVLAIVFALAAWKDMANKS